MPRRQQQQRSFSPKSILPFLATFLLLLLSTPSVQGSAASCYEQDRGGGGRGGLLRSLKQASKPLRQSIKETYNECSKKERFVASAAAGFVSARLAVRITIKTIKTVGAAYIAFEALEYTGILTKARQSTTPTQKEILIQIQNYVLRTVDEIRCDIRTHCNPVIIKTNIEKGFRKDRIGMTGFSTGAFLGFVL